MGFDRVVKVNEAHQLDMAVLVVLEHLLAMPHVHQGTDDAFRLAVGLGSVGAGELLADALLCTGLSEAFEAVLDRLKALVGVLCRGVNSRRLARFRAL